MQDRTFVIDSDHLEKEQSRLYGYMVSDDGEVFIDEIPDEISDTGLFCLVVRDGDKLTVRQDFLTSFGLFTWSEGARFCVSNSFFRLVEHVREHCSAELSLDVNYTASLVTAADVPLACGNTMAREISKLRSGDHVVIDIPSRTMTVESHPYPVYQVQLDNAEAFARLDAWFWKWVRVYRGLVEKDVPIATDLSGGLDTRVVLSMFRRANVDVGATMPVLTREYVNLEKDSRDYLVAKHIAETLGFQLNDKSRLVEKKVGPNTTEDVYNAAKYTSFGRSTLPIYGLSCYDEPFFSCKGLGSTTKGGFWAGPANALATYRSQYKTGVEDGLRMSSAGEAEGRKNKRKGLVSFLRRRPQMIEQELYNERTVTKLLEGFEGVDSHKATLLYLKLKMADRDGCKVMDWMNRNQFIISPFIDPAIAEFDYNPNDNDILYLNTLIFDRYDPEMLDFEVENRAFQDASRERARELNAAFPSSLPGRDAFAPLSRVQSPVSKHSIAKEAFREYLLEHCRTPEFRRVVGDVVGDDYVTSAVNMAVDDPTDRGLRRIAALLAVYEFMKPVGER